MKSTVIVIDIQMSSINLNAIVDRSGQHRRCYQLRAAAD